MSLKFGQNVDEFFCKIVPLFQEDDPTMKEELKIAVVRRTLRGFGRDCKFIATQSFRSVEQMRSAVYRLAEADKLVGTTAARNKATAGVVLVQYIRGESEWNWRT